MDLKSCTIFLTWSVTSQTRGIFMETVTVLFKEPLHELFKRHHFLRQNCKLVSLKGIL